MKNSTMRPIFHKIQIVNRLIVALNCINWAIYKWAVHQFILMMAFVAHSSSDAVCTLFFLWFIFNYNVAINWYATLFIFHFSFFLFSFLFILFLRLGQTATEKDAINVTSKKTVQSEHTCRYGNLTLNVGEVIQIDEPCLECFCKTPPMAQCVRIITTEKCHWYFFFSFLLRNRDLLHIIIISLIIYILETETKRKN